MKPKEMEDTFNSWVSAWTSANKVDIEIELANRKDALLKDKVRIYALEMLLKEKS